MNTNLDKTVINSEQKFLFFKSVRKSRFKSEVKSITKAVITTFIIVQAFSFFTVVKDFSFLYNQNMVLTKKGAIFNKVPNQQSYTILSRKINETLLQVSTGDTRMVLDYLDRSVTDKGLTNNLSKTQQQDILKSIKEYKYNNIQSLEKNFKYMSQTCLDGKFSRNLFVECIAYQQLNMDKDIANEKLIIDNKISSIEKSL